MAILRRGLYGEPVRMLQEKLGVAADGVFGAETEKALIAYQTKNGLAPDGIAGPDTFTAMEMPHLVQLQQPLRGNQVRKLQTALGIEADGHFGPGTAAAVKAFQRKHGLPEDGIAGPQTLALIPAFATTPEQVAKSLLNALTPPVEREAIAAAQAQEAQSQGTSPKADLVDTTVASGAAVADVGKSVWTSVRNIFG